VCYKKRKYPVFHRILLKIYLLCKKVKHKFIQSMDRKRKQFEEQKLIRLQSSLLYYRFPKKGERAFFDAWNRTSDPYSILSIEDSSRDQQEFVSRDLDEIEKEVIKCYSKDWRNKMNRSQVVKYFYNENLTFFDLTCENFKRLIDKDGWLQSPTIIFFMFLLKLVSTKSSQHNNVHFFTSDFFDLVRLIFFWFFLFFFLSYIHSKR